LPDPQTLYDVTIRVGAFVGSITSVATLIAMVRKRLRGKVGRSRTRRGELYLPDGEMHHWEMSEE
jgi:hypothetical protein